jgi:serine/threonine protein kinase
VDSGPGLRADFLGGRERIPAPRGILCYSFSNSKFYAFSWGGWTKEKGPSSRRMPGERTAVHTRLRLEAGAEPFPGLRLVQLRGRGGFAEVWEAHNEIDEPIALKFISSERTTTTVKEVKSLQALQQIRHPNILRTDRVWSAPGYIVIAMELADASLLDLLDAYAAEYKIPIPPEVLMPYMLQAAAGLDFMNARRHPFEGRTVGFQHCDVKPSNILLLGDTVKLADFGLSWPTNAPNNPYSKCGTLDFAAPEIHRGVLTEKSDQYSLAVSYYLLRTGHFPFPPPPEGFRRQYSYKRPAPSLNLVGREERRVLERALDVQHEKRFENCDTLVRELSATCLCPAAHHSPCTSIVVAASDGSRS